MWNRSYWLIGIAVAILGGAAAAITLRAHLNEHSHAPNAPVLQCPAVLDLGPQEVGTVAVGTLTISNRGAQDLLIDQIRTSCSCTGLERKTPDGFHKIEELKVRADSSVDLTVRLSVPGPVAESFATSIAFRTNDPDRPEAAVAVVVPHQTGGIRSDPKTVVFGAVPLGTTADRELSVIDYATTPRSIRSLFASPPELLSVELLPADQEDMAAGPRSGKTLARLRVHLKANEPGPFDGKVIVVLDGREQKPDTIAVSARIDRPVELIPSALVLPLTTGAGELRYEASCRCRARNGKPVSVIVEVCPDGVTAAVNNEEEEPSQKRITIKLKPDSLTAGQIETRSVRFRVKVGEETHVLEFPVVCRGG